MTGRAFVTGMIGGVVLGLIGAATAAEPTGEIVLMGYPGAFQDNYTKTVIEPFMKAHPGVKVIYNAAGNSAQMLGMLRAQKAKPEADVVIIDFSVSRVGNKEGLFEKFDATSVPNLADIYDAIVAFKSASSVAAHSFSGLPPLLEQQVAKVVQFLFIHCQHSLSILLVSSPYVCFAKLADCRLFITILTELGAHQTRWCRPAVFRSPQRRDSRRQCFSRPAHS